MEGGAAAIVRVRVCGLGVRAVATHEDLARRVASVVQRMQPRASRLVRVHQFYWLRMWLESGAMRTGDGGVPRTKEDVADRIYVVGGHA